MKKILTTVLLFSLLLTNAQVFEVETIKNSGSNDKRINLVILSEGYQASELAQFKTDAIALTNTIFSTAPFTEYANYFNVHIVKVPSNESGADHPGTASNENGSTLPIQFKDTYFNATYDAYGNHRLLYYEIDRNNANNTASKIADVLANNVPEHDNVLILVNSTEYGGSGGIHSMGSKGTNGAEIMIHEMGHSLFKLKDEYFPESVEEAINMTQETNPTAVRWKNWLGQNGIGIYPHGTTGISANWYRPHQNCLMRYVGYGYPFCSVCKEGMIEKIHSLVSPIDAYTPIASPINNPTFPLDFELNLIKPIPNTLESTWTLNAVEFATNVDAIAIEDTDLNTGINTLSVAITDASTLLKVDNHDTFHVNTVTWTIDNSSLGVEDITSTVSDFNIAMYPNPTNNIINFKFESDTDSFINIEIIGLDGKKIKSVSIENFQTTPIDISTLSHGIYLANFYSKNALIATKKLVKN